MHWECAFIKLIQFNAISSMRFVWHKNSTNAISNVSNSIMICILNIFQLKYNILIFRRKAKEWTNN